MSGTTLSGLPHMQSQASQSEPESSVQSLFPKITPRIDLERKSHLLLPGFPFLHRDLTWLQFNLRVLHEAFDPSESNPALERAKFLAISASNLDEFFMIRVPSLHRSLIEALQQEETGAPPGTALYLQRVHHELFKATAGFKTKQAKAFHALKHSLKEHSIHFVLHQEETKLSHELGAKIFKKKILPFLKLELFSWIQLRTLENLQASAIFPKSQAWAKLPKNLPGIFVHRDTKKGLLFVFFTDQLFLSHAKKYLHQKGPLHLVRVTRDADFATEIGEQENPHEVSTKIRAHVQKRERGQPTRLQFTGKLSHTDLAHYCSALHIRKMQSFSATGTIFLHSLWKALPLMKKKVPRARDLFFKPFKPRVPQILRAKSSIFKVLKKNDILLHHPFDAFDAFESFLDEAVKDPKVTQIEQALYRVDLNSKMIQFLKKAALKKKVRLIIEPRARFDELNNLNLSEDLKAHGIEVSFGLPHLKIHSKVTLVTRVEDGTETYYTHFSTGNYNAQTARQYTDVGLLTSNFQLGYDARQFFNSIFLGKEFRGYKALVSAPRDLHRTLIAQIQNETNAALKGKPAMIFAKVNALVDEAVIQALYHASSAGVKVNLIVRGACSLVPGIKGFSENIRVRSVVDRFLEHSRIFYFKNSDNMYFSSADWMPRNFFSRIEFAFPIFDKKIKAFVKETLIPIYLAENTKSWNLLSSGKWRKRATSKKKKAHAQKLLMNLASNHYEGTPLE